MCTQKPPNDFSQQLYDRYKEAYNTYIRQKARPKACSAAQRHCAAPCAAPPPAHPRRRGAGQVLPALKTLHGETMLRELVKRWNNHKARAAQFPAGREAGKPAAC